jgi:hypothetical protein
MERIASWTKLAMRPTMTCIAIRVHSQTSSQRCAAHTHKSVVQGWHAKTFKAVNSNFDQRLM